MREMNIFSCNKIKIVMQQYKIISVIFVHMINQECYTIISENISNIYSYDKLKIIVSL